MLNTTCEQTPVQRGPERRHVAVVEQRPSRTTFQSLKSFRTIVGPLLEPRFAALPRRRFGDGPSTFKFIRDQAAPHRTKCNAESHARIP